MLDSNGCAALEIEGGEVDGVWGSELEEEQPTAIDPRRHLHYVEVSEDGLVATYAARGDYTDVGAVQANRPCPRNCAIAYYEMTILEASPTRPSICMGLSPASALLNKPPGMEPRSVGYRAEDGRKHCRKARPASGVTEPVSWEVFGSAYGQGDVVGCGILNSSRGIFFTRNGVFIGHAGKVSSLCDIYPTASMRHTGDSIRMNFSGPFLFNLRLLFHRQLLEERQLIRQEVLAQSTLYSLVRSYLLHAGFHATLRSLDMALRERQEKNDTGGGEGTKCSKSMSIEQTPGRRTSFGTDSDDIVCASVGSQSPEEEEGPHSNSKEDQEATLVSWPPQVPGRLKESLVTRAEIQRAVMEGRVSTAVDLLSSNYPLVLVSSNDEACVLARALLFSQEVIECLRAPRRDVESAVQCMQTRISGLMAQAPPHIQKALCDCLGILAYEDPEQSPLAKVFHPSRRSLAASAVNRCILKKHLHVTVWSPLELLVRHLVACRQVLRILGGSRGPIPSSREYCHPLPLRQTIEALEAELL